MSQPPANAPKPAITAVGVAVFWIGCALIVLGGVRFSGVTLLLGLFALAILGAARFLCSRNLDGLEFARQLPKSAFAGELFESSVLMKTTTQEEAGRNLEFRDSLLHGTVFQSLDEGSEFSIRARLPRRGRQRRAQYEVKSSWPFGLFQANRHGVYVQKKGSSPDETLIFPRPLMPAVLLRQLEDFQAESLARDSFDMENAGDFRGIRPYRPGDSVKSIHWPATARASELVVRDWDPPRPKPRRFGIILHSLASPGQLLTPERFETAVRITTGLLIFCRMNGIPVWVSTDVRKSAWLKIPEKTGFSIALTELAELRSTTTKSPSKLQRRIADFQTCERVFVISDSAVENWSGTVSGRHPSLILSDPDSVSTPKSRRVRVVNSPMKIT